MLESVRTLARRRLEPRERHDDAVLVRHLPYVAAVTDDVLMLRDGEIMATFAVDGIGAATAESVLVGDVADAVRRWSPRRPTSASISTASPSSPTRGCRRRSTPIPSPSRSTAAGRRRRGDGVARASLVPDHGAAAAEASRALDPVFGAGATAQRDHLARRVERLNEAISYLMETSRSPGRNG